MDTDTLNLIFGIIGTIGTVLGIVGIIQAARGNKKKEPVYSIKSVNVISGYTSTYANLTVSYKGEKVESFTVSKVLFFNRGASVLDKNDRVQLNPIRIQSKSGFILDASVVQVNNPSSDFKVILDNWKDAVVLDFDYLNQNHGAVIEVIHTGISSEDIDIVGDIKEVKELKKLPSTSMKPALTRKLLPFVMATSFFALCLIFGMAINAYNILTRDTPDFGTYVYVTVISVTITLFAIRMAMYLLPTGAAIPKGLEAFLE